MAGIMVERKQGYEQPIPQDPLARLRGESVEAILTEGSFRITKSTLNKLLQIEQTLRDQGKGGLIYDLAQAYLNGASLRELVRQTGLRSKGVRQLFTKLGLPIRTQAEAVRAMLEERWQDQEFRQRNAEAVRQARLNPDNLSRYHLPTIYGERWDIDFAQSSWEANLARVLRLVGRGYLPHQRLRLDDGSLFGVDFLTLDRRGRMVAYEIMVHPQEDPKGWDKLEEAISNYPNIVFRIVDHGFYDRLKNRFAQRISQDSNLAGWEDKDDNLRTNPQKYGR